MADEDVKLRLVSSPTLGSGGGLSLSYGPAFLLPPLPWYQRGWQGLRWRILAAYHWIRRGMLLEP